MLKKYISILCCFVASFGSAVEPRIEASKPKFLVGEPVELNLYFQPLEGVRENREGDGIHYWSIHYRSVDDDRFFGLSIWESIAVDGDSFKGGEVEMNKSYFSDSKTFVDQETMQYATGAGRMDRSELPVVLHEVGEFEFVLLYSVYVGDAKQTYRSMPIRVDVLEPNGLDAEVWEILSSNKKVFWFASGDFYGDDVGGEEIDMLVEILKKYPETTYAESIKRFMMNSDDYRVQARFDRIAARLSEVAPAEPGIARVGEGSGNLVESRSEAMEAGEAGPVEVEVSLSRRFLISGSVFVVALFALAVLVSRSCRRQ